MHCILQCVGLQAPATPNCLQPAAHLEVVECLLHVLVFASAPGQTSCTLAAYLASAKPHLLCSTRVS